MDWYNAIKAPIDAIKNLRFTSKERKQLQPLIDLTRLQEADTETNVAHFCQNAFSPEGAVAAVCVYPAFVRLVASILAGSPVKVATVVNFPEGLASLEDVLFAINSVMENGAQEIDLVFPYARYLAGERRYVQSFIQVCKAACGAHTVLKVILETGVLQDPAIIADASFDVLTAGADFIKTSTGKIPEGATLQAGATMLLVIKHLRPKLMRDLGLKVSGGIREWQQAAQYVALAREIMGSSWECPATFRIGTSQVWGNK